MSSYAVADIGEESGQPGHPPPPSLILGKKKEESQKEKKPAGQTTIPPTHLAQGLDCRKQQIDWVDIKFCNIFSIWYAINLILASEFFFFASDVG